jgi:glycosyltransferase involved in cell wall biosynthesis
MYKHVKISVVETPPLKISVITAAFKSEVTVGEAISSVAAQTYADVEHLIVEGNSRDGAVRLMRTSLRFPCPS